MIKIIPYIIALILSPAISAILAYFAGIIYVWPNIVFKHPLNFWFGISIGGVESFIIVWISIWIFNWFGFLLPIFFIILITMSYLLNNIYRCLTRWNKPKEFGYLLIQLFAILVIYYQSIKGDFDGVFVFW
jgi:hypothetical protein